MLLIATSPFEIPLFSLSISNPTEVPSASVNVIIDPSFGLSVSVKVAVAVVQVTIFATRSVAVPLPPPPLA